MKTIVLDGRSLTFEDVRALYDDGYDGRVRLVLASASARKMKKSRGVVDKAIREKRTVYGINTGFGKLSDTHIEPGHIEQLQRNLLLSHAVGRGVPFFPAGMIIAFRANSLARGQSGVTVELVRYLIEMFNRGVDPIIPTVGSVGASGDLAPLAELGCVMMGEGKAGYRGAWLPARKALAKAKLAPYRFKAKEALSLINGTQLMSALLAELIIEAGDLLKLADIAGAMSLEALKGSVKPFDARIHAARPHPGQIAVAGNFRRLLLKSEVLESHRNCRKVQDAYCLRCIPQVHGATRDAVEFAKQVLIREINSATDNPLVFENGDIISGGNFHGQPLAQAADLLAASLATLANISERRIDRLTNPDLSELPGFLIKDSGLNSGFMMVQVLAAALAAECRVYAMPASVQSIPTGASKEDHVSMGPLAAKKALDVCNKALNVVRLELICAAQGLDFLKPLRPGAGVLAAHGAMRKQLPHVDRDIYMREHLKLEHEDVLDAVEKKIGALA